MDLIVKKSFKHLLQITICPSQRTNAVNTYLGTLIKHYSY